MAWFDEILAEERAEFWAQVNRHEFVSRTLSYELTRTEYLPLFRDLLHCDRRLPAVLRLAAARCGSGREALGDWLLARADEHSGWSRMWGPMPDRDDGPSRGAEGLVDTAARLAVREDPASLFGAMTAFCWFESIVAGALHDVLGGICGLDAHALGARTGSDRHDPARFERLLAEIAGADERRGFAEGLRAPLPHLAAMLSSSCRPEPVAIEPSADPLGGWQCPLVAVAGGGAREAATHRS